MKITVQVKLQPDNDQKNSLLDTLRTANAACNWLSGKVWLTRCFRYYDLHKLMYRECRAAFPTLSSQVVVRAEVKVTDAYKLNKATRRKFRQLGAISYDARILSWKPDVVSLWTIGGRQKIGYVCGPRQSELLQYDRGEADLVHREGEFYLLVSVDIPDVAEGSVDGWIGVDLGIAQIATDSDGVVYHNSQIDCVRQRRIAHRQRLARAARARYRHGLRSRSIRRAIMRHGGKESRFRRDVNHCISKSIVAKAKGTARGIALENLKGITIRTVKRLRRKQRSRHGSWSFYQLRTFIEYKAKMLGIPVVVVDPRNTSRTCAECGHSEKANRQSQSRFQCRRCGHTANADVNAARNISRGVAINRPMVSERRRFRSLASTGTSCSNNS